MSEHCLPCARYSSSVTWQWVLLSHWSAPKQAPPTSSQLSRSNLWWGGFVQLLVECRSWDREWDKRWLPASPQDPLAHQALGQWVSWRAQGIGWRLCLPTGLGSGLDGSHECLPHPLFCDLIAASLQVTTCGTCPRPVCAAWGAWEPVGLGTWLPQWWPLGRVWELGPEGPAANWAVSPPLSLDPDLGGWKLYPGTWTLPNQNRE